MATKSLLQSTESLENQNLRIKLSRQNTCGLYIERGAILISLFQFIIY
jgi:hypothetical protein